MLENIQSPRDLKGRPLSELTQISLDIRNAIIGTVSKNGGHLASNLGAVEMTVALHATFDAPEDKILFDVGHQAYAHKMLTGRYAAFDTLRQRGGVSGFLRPDESEYDAAPTGHASSAISIALGMARARDLMGRKCAVVAVVGDGALTGGLCYEALNDAGQSGLPLIVILNDNAMSISKNVGALSGYLTGLRQSTPYRSLKRAIRDMLGGKKLGAPVLRALMKARDALRSLFVDGQFFEALGFDYQGPIDGHDIARMLRVFARAREAVKPVLIHIVTQKGHGYAPAEARPENYHGIAPFFIESGRPASEGGVTNGQIMAAQLNAMAETDARICAITAAMPAGTGLSAFAARHPERFFDVGIAEAHAVTMAAGLALMGMRPYVALYSTFLQRAYDQLIEDVSLPNLPVTLLIDRAGLVGSDGATHQGAYDLQFLRAMPGMTVAAPRDARDLKRLLTLSLEMDGPLAIRYPRDAEDMGPGMQERAPLHVGEWERLASGDVEIFAIGRMVETALSASIELHGRGIQAGVTDARFIKPLDEALLIEAARGAKLVVTIEEGTALGGLGSAVLEVLSAQGIQTPTLVLGLPDRFIEQGSIGEQMHDAGLTPSQVSRRVQDALQAIGGAR